MLEKGYVHIYTGNGKGKTSAALGLAFRAAGSGLRSVIIQFMKGLPTGEMEAASAFGGAIAIEQFGSMRFCLPNDATIEEHRMLARKGYDRAVEVLRESRYDIVVLDEVITAISFSLLSVDEIVSLIEARPPRIELILTGRGATQRLIDYADLVTEMKEVKHYYYKGVSPRRGIED